jgi:hypothetical protein
LKLWLTDTENWRTDVEGVFANWGTEVQVIISQASAGKIMAMELPKKLYGPKSFGCLSICE